MKQKLKSRFDNTSKFQYDKKLTALYMYEFIESKCHPLSKVCILLLTKEKNTKNFSKYIKILFKIFVNVYFRNQLAGMRASRAFRSRSGYEEVRTSGRHDILAL